MLLTRRGLIKASAASTLALAFPELANAGSHGKPLAAYSQIGVLLYGQSNTGFMSGKAEAVVPAALTGTSNFDGTSFGAVPAFNGIRTLLNGIKTATGFNCWGYNGAIAAQSLWSLSKGNSTDYPNMIKAMLAAYNQATDKLVIYYQQGEGDATSGQETSRWYWVQLLGQLHQDICSDLGRTTANTPMIVSSLATASFTGINVGYEPNNWEYQQETIKAAGAWWNSQNIFFSHSNTDANIVDAGVHWDGNSYGRSGVRGAQSLAWLLGYAAGPAIFTIGSIAIVSATQTDVTVVHGQGTDFTPSSGITGFDINDNGLWVAATGARQDATTIRLTHAPATTASREVRYQYGGQANVTTPAYDNSSITAPLVLSGLPIQSEPHVNPIFIGTVRTSNVSHDSKTFVSPAYILLPEFSTRRIIVHYVNEQNTSVASVTITPSSGPPVTVTPVNYNHASPARCYGVASALVPAGTSFTVTVTASSAVVFDAYAVHVWYVDESLLTSTTPVTAETTSASSTTITGSITVATAKSCITGIAFGTGAGGADGTPYQSATGDPSTPTTCIPGVAFSIGGLTGLTFICTDLAAGTKTLVATFPNSGNNLMLLAAWG